MKPFLKFPGGKAYLANNIIECFPKSFRNYHEPMVGGGALFFELVNRGMLHKKRAFLSDINSWLMHMYKAIESDPQKVVEQLCILKKKHQKCIEKYGSAEKFYYYVRKFVNKQHLAKQQIPEASVLIYLNKTCFNGLFRFNQKGFFNAPFGKQENAKIFSSENILAIGKALRKYVTFGMPNYHYNMQNVKPQDLVYFDPPYWPINNNSFVSYSQYKFTVDDQIILANYAKDLKNKRKAHVILSNVDIPEVRNLYKGFNLQTVSAPRRINRDGKGRGKVKELLITSF